MIIISMNNSKLLSCSFDHLQRNSLVDTSDGQLFHCVVPENIPTPQWKGPPPLCKCYIIKLQPFLP